MKNFEINKNLCILWTDKCHNILINKITTENSFLKKLVEDNFTLGTKNIKNKKPLI